jgi:hypothetical protein
LIFFTQEFPIGNLQHLLLVTEGGMNLRDALRQAEQQGKQTVHSGAEKLHNIETSIRRKLHGREASSTSSDAVQDSEASRSSTVRTGIVSVNGRDVEQMRCTGGRHTG